MKTQAKQQDAPRRRVLVRKLALVACVAAVATAAFFWGRLGAAPRATAQAPPPRHHEAPPTVPVGNPDYGRRVVAVLFGGSVPITREELGEYLIARFGPERLEFLVNRRIIEIACRQKNITVTDAEVDAKLKEELAAFNVSQKDFVEKILKRMNKTLYEYREDKIRPEIAMTKLCKDKLKVTEEDIQKAFEAKYGPKVRCRMIVLGKEVARQATEIWQKVSKSEEEFNEYARKQFIGELAARGGEIPLIHKHFPDPRIEKEAFSLRNKGDVSALIDMPDQTKVILKLVEHISPDTTAKLSGDERVKLHDECMRAKLAQMIPEEFKRLRDLANPSLLLRRDGEIPREEQYRQVEQQLSGKSGLPAAPRGN